MTPDRVRHAVCLNRACPRPADVTVTLPEAAPGVYMWPALHCTGCGWAVNTLPAPHAATIHPTGAPSAVIYPLDDAPSTDPTSAAAAPDRLTTIRHWLRMHRDYNLTINPWDLYGCWSAHLTGPGTLNYVSRGETLSARLDDVEGWIATIGPAQAAAPATVAIPSLTHTTTLTPIDATSTLPTGDTPALARTPPPGHSGISASPDGAR